MKENNHDLMGWNAPGSGNDDDRGNGSQNKDPWSRNNGGNRRDPMNEINE